MPSPHVLVIHNQPVLPAGHPDYASEADVLETRDAVVKILGEGGFSVEALGVSTDVRTLLNHLEDKRPDAVFNLFEGLADHNVTEISVASLLEWQKVPFTGSPSSAIALGRDKLRTKYLLQGAGLPTPRFQIFEGAGKVDWPYDWPAIAKPALQDASVGIAQRNVVTNSADLQRQVELLQEQYGDPVLIEEFIFGREFHVNIVEDYSDDSGIGLPLMVPLTEVRFDYGEDKGYWPIYSYEAKWNEKSKEYGASVFDAPVYLEPEMMERLEVIARQTFRLVGLRDYARLDIRLSEQGIPYILEVNPNPYLLSLTLVKGLEAMGRTHPEQVRDFVYNAAFRGGNGPPPPVRTRPKKQPRTKTY